MLRLVYAGIKKCRCKGSDTDECRGGSDVRVPLYQYVKDFSLKSNGAEADKCCQKIMWKEDNVSAVNVVD
jgi:hypothetical protein